MEHSFWRIDFECWRWRWDYLFLFFFLCFFTEVIYPRNRNPLFYARGTRSKVGGVEKDVILAISSPRPVFWLLGEKFQCFSFMKMKKFPFCAFSSTHKSLPARFFHTFWNLIFKMCRRNSISSLVRRKWKCMESRNPKIFHQRESIFEIFVRFSRKPDDNICSNIDSYTILALEVF